MGEGSALHGGAGYRNRHQPRPQPLPEVCPGVHAEGPRLPARSALGTSTRHTLMQSKAAVAPVSRLQGSVAQA